MDKYYTLQEASELKGLSVRRLQQLCTQQKIKSATKINGMWMISDLDDIPARERNRRGAARLPIGLSYEEACREALVIDKSLLIRDILFSQAKTILFTRPRRFGKSMNLDMLKCFFEKNHPERDDLFDDKAISKYQTIMSTHHMKYNVISLSFLGMDTDAEGVAERVGYAVYEQYRVHKDVLEIDQETKDFFDELRKPKCPLSYIERSLRELIFAFKEPVIVLIDEYDAPIQYGYLHGEYEKVLSFFRNFLSLALKDHPNCKLAILSGVTRLAKESVFSGFNSAKTNGVDSMEFSTYFGFTEKETKELFKKVGGMKHYEEAKRYYDGFRFGLEKVFNPWSIANYINSGYVPDYYWSNTSNNALIEASFDTDDPLIDDSLLILLEGKPLKGVYISEDFSFGDLEGMPTAIWSLLVSSGYLSVDEERNVIIPNLEARHCFEDRILARINGESYHGHQRDFVIALENNDIRKIEAILSNFIKDSVSNLLAYKEEFYHGLFLGMIAFASKGYEIKTEYEAGLGRSDIILLPKDERPSIVVEIKRLLSATGEELKKESEKAIHQIIDRGYIPSNCDAIIYGIAFCKKEFHIESEIKTK